ncbi:START domain-containing protein [Corallincola platygyrae]|uniref:START domain-containing protein n=1 Tax=Corallincola platygyrae TaxID=1193278 RepID=A0ABW4XI09_9GAMM
MKTSLLLLTLLILSSPLLAKEWQLQLSENGINIYSQTMDKPPYMRLRAELQLEATRGSFLTLLLHTESTRDWVEHAEGADVIIFQPPNRHLVHTRFNPPWPVNRRDLVTVSRYWEEPVSGNLYLAAESRPNAFPAQEDYIRLLKAEACWQISPLKPNAIRVRYEGFTDPGSHLPYFVTNQVGIEALHETFKKLRKQLQRPEYRYARPEIPKTRERQSKPCDSLLANEP